MTDATSAPALPDHLSSDPRRPPHNAAAVAHATATRVTRDAPRDVASSHIRFSGKERFDVQEYCVSEGWVKVPAGKTVDRKGQPLLIKLKGTVEALYR